MNEEEKLQWGFAPDSSLWSSWPKDSAGEPEAPAFLCTCRNLNMGDELLINMLQAYGIPCLRMYPGDGSFGKIVLGMSGLGTDIYVPESMLSDAIALCKEDKHEEL